jgi:hypothetical protein
VTTALVTPPADVASTAQAPAIPAGTDITSRTAVEYLTTGSEDAFDHLVHICLRAKKKLFIVPLDQGNRMVWDEKTFAKMKDSGQKIYHDDKRSQTTKEWVQEFVLKFLAPFRNATPEEVLEAAAQGKFRYMGRMCRLRMIDEVRHQTTAKNMELFLGGIEEEPEPKLLDPENQDSAAESELYDLETRDRQVGDQKRVRHNHPHDWIGQSPEDAARSSLGYSPTFTEDELKQVLQDNRAAYESVLGKRLFIVFQVVCQAYFDGLSEGDTTKAVAERLRVQIRQAQRYRDQLCKKMADTRKVSDAIQELHGLLLQGGQRRGVLIHSRPPARDEYETIQGREPRDYPYLDKMT